MRQAQSFPVGPLERREEERIRAGRGYVSVFGRQIGREWEGGQGFGEMGGRGRVHADRGEPGQMGRGPDWEDRDRRKEHAGIGSRGRWQEDEERNLPEHVNQRRENPGEYDRDRRYPDEEQEERYDGRARRGWRDRPEGPRGEGVGESEGRRMADRAEEEWVPRRRGNDARMRGRTFL
jgi:hypothetical protein